MPSPTTAREHGLAAAIESIEQVAASGGWDGPLRVFALVETGVAAATDAEFAAQIVPPDAFGVVRADDLPEGHLTPIEQQELPEAPTVEGIIAQIAWPDEVAGAALVVERIVLATDDGTAKLPATSALNAPGRRDVRIAVGVLRSGESWCVLRLKSADDPAMRLQGADLVPGLVEQLTATFKPL